MSGSAHNASVRFSVDAERFASTKLKRNCTVHKLLGFPFRYKSDFLNADLIRGASVSSAWAADVCSNLSNDRSLYRFSAD